MTRQKFEPEIYMPPAPGLINTVRDPNAGAILLPESVTEGSAFIAAQLLDQRFAAQPISAVDLGCNEANWLLYLVEATQITKFGDMLGVDTSLYACIGAVANLEAERPYLLEDIKTRVWWRSWDSVLDGSETFDVVGFNPPFGTNRANYVPEFQNAPPEAVLVPTGEKPDHHYSQVVPMIGRILNPGGLAVIRTPRAPYWRNQILRIAQAAFSSEEYAIHSFVVHGTPNEHRTGRGFIVEKAVDGIRPHDTRYTATLSDVLNRTPTGWQYKMSGWILSQTSRTR